MVKNLPAMQETWVRSLEWEDPLEKGMPTHSSILAWRISRHRGAWRATVYGVARVGPDLVNKSPPRSQLTTLVVSRQTAKALSHIYTCIHSPQTPLPDRLPHNTVRAPVLYSRSLLVFHFKYSSIYTSTDPFLSTWIWTKTDSLQLFLNNIK